MTEKQKVNISDRPSFDSLFINLCLQSSLPQEELKKIFDKYADKETAIMSLESFSTFLLSPENSVVAEQDKGVWHDMTRPLSEYYISSSHNTYLVGHQLVGVSTVEGYIRALLHSCRSVELTCLFFCQLLHSSSY